MQTLNYAELAFLSTLVYPELTRKVLMLYAEKTFIFSPVAHPHLNIMWNEYMALLKKYKEQYGLSLDRQILAAGLSEAVGADDRLPQELKIKCDILLEKLTSDDVPDLEHGTKLIKQLVELDANRRIISKINENAGLIELQQSLDASRRTMTLVDDSDSKEEEVGNVFKPFKDIRKLVKHVERIPTGVNYLDAVSGGGGRPGELWLILGPPSGGKTIMAVQYACGQALTGNGVVWATYEQTLEGDVSERMVAHITDTSLEQIRDVGFDNLDPAIQDRFWKSVSGVDDSLTALDMTRLNVNPQDPDDYGGAMSLWKAIREVKSDGGVPPKTLVLDWFGAMMSRIASNLHLDLSDCYRHKALEEILKLQRLAKEEKLLIIVFHQLDSKAAHARPTYLADATQAQEMHNLQNNFDLVAVIGRKDVNNICYFSNPKARKGGNIVRTLRMVGEKSRFVLEDGWLPNTDGNFYKPGANAGAINIKGAADRYLREVD